MLMYPHIDPVALQLGPLAVHWYGLTYLAAFGLFMLLGLRRLQHPAFAHLPVNQSWSRKDVEDILFLGVLGVIVGGRLGYCLFYKPGYYLSHPLEIFAVWTGGMSFHGGLLGVIAAMLWFALDYSKTIQQLTGKRLLADLLWLGCILISTFIAFFVGYIQGSFASF